MIKPIRPKAPSKNFCSGSYLLPPSNSSGGIPQWVVDAVNSGKARLIGYILATQTIDNPIYDEEKAKYDLDIKEYEKNLQRYQEHQAQEKEKAALRRKQNVHLAKQRIEKRDITLLKKLLNSYSHLPEVQEKIKQIG
jgi:hypothetical protein